MANKVITIKQIQAIEKEMLQEVIKIFERHHICFYMCCGSVLGTVRHHGPIPWDTDMDILIPLPQLMQARNILEKELPQRFCIDDLANNKDYKNLFPRIAMPHSSSDTLHIDLFPLMGLPDDKQMHQTICNELQKRQNVFIRLKHYRTNIVHMNFFKNIIGKSIELLCSPYSKSQLEKQYYSILHRYPYEEAKYVMNACGHYGAKNIFEKTVFGTPTWMVYDNVQVPLPEQWDFYLRRYYKEYMQLPPKEERDFWSDFTLEIDDRDYEAVKDIIENEQK